MHACMHACVSTCTCAPQLQYIYICRCMLHRHLHIPQTRPCTHMCTHIYLSIHPYTHSCNTCMHAHTRACAHAHAHTWTRAPHTHRLTNCWEPRAAFGVSFDLFECQCRIARSQASAGRISCLDVVPSFRPLTSVSPFLWREVYITLRAFASLYAGNSGRDMSTRIPSCDGAEPLVLSRTINAITRSKWKCCPGAHSTSPSDLMPKRNGIQGCCASAVTAMPSAMG